MRRKNPSPAPSDLSAAGYIRVSKKDLRHLSPEESEVFIDSRRQELLSEAKRRGFVLVQIYEDISKSAGEGVKRPGFEGMLAAIREGKINAILGKNQSRLFRDVTDRGIHAREFSRLGVKVLFLEEADWEDTAAGRLTSNVQVAADAFLRERVGEDIYLHRLTLAESGLLTGGKGALGLVWSKKQRRFLADKYAPLVRKIFALFLETNSAMECAKRLNRSGERTKQGNLFTSPAVLRILRSPLYRGHQRFDGELYPVETDRIVDESTIASVDAILARWAASPLPRPRTSVKGPFTGFLTCGLCGYALVRQQKRGKEGKPVFYYCCTNHKQRGLCPQTSIREERLARALSEAVTGFLSGQARLDQKALNLTPPPKSTKEAAPSSKDSLEKLKRQRENLLDLFLSSDKHTSEHVAYRARLEDINAQISALEKETPPALASKARLLAPEVLSALTSSWQQFPSLPFEEQRTLVESLSIRLKADGEVVTLEALGEILPPIHLPPLRNQKAK